MGLRGCNRSEGAGRRVVCKRKRRRELSFLMDGRTVTAAGGSALGRRHGHGRVGCLCEWHVGLVTCSASRHVGCRGHGSATPARLRETARTFARALHRVLRSRR